MWRRLMKRLTNNFGLKILAVVFAIILWLIVVNVEDPDRTTLMTVPVTIENEGYLTEMGKTYEILRNANVSFTVSASRSVLKELSESDFTAVANMENINEQMTMVPITITASRYANQIEISRRASAGYLHISVENLVTEKFTISPELEGTPAEYCYIDETKVNPKRVTVTGPESVVSRIETAQVHISVEGAEENVVTNGEIELLDENGETVPQDRLSLNRTKAAVDVVIMMGKSVPLQIQTIGTLQEGYMLGSVSSSVEQVHLTGPPEVLDQISSLEITSQQLDISARTTDFKTVINLLNFLPEEVSLAEGEPANVEISVEIIGQKTKNFRVPVENITVENLADGWKLDFQHNTVSVTLRGFEEDLQKIDASALRGRLDASGLTRGTHTVSVIIEGEYDVAGDVHAAVTVTSEDGQDGAGGDADSTEPGPAEDNTTGGSSAPDTEGAAGENRLDTEKADGGT